MAVNQLEIKRQIFHLFLGVATVLLLNYNIITAPLMLIGAVKGILLSLLSRKFRIPIVSWLLDTFERKEDLKTFPGRGAIYYAIGCFIAVALFPKDIAMASILILAFGDSASHFAGVHIGKIKHPLNDKKFLEGTLFGFIAAFVAASFVISPIEALLASLAAMLIEAVEVKFGSNMVNDNLIIPVLAGVVVYLVRAVSF